PKADPAPTQAASAGKAVEQVTGKVKETLKAPAATVQAATDVAKERLFANPTRPNAMSAGGKEQILESESALGAGSSVKSYFTGVYGLNRDDVVLKRLVPGRHVIAGTILGRIGKVLPGVAPNVLFEIRPAGRGAPRIDPKPILDGWKLLESTAIYRAQGKNPFFGEGAQGATIGQILLMSKESLIQRVLADPRIELYSCGARDVRAGVVDRRVLAMLEFLASSGMKPTVTSLRCGHGFYTASGNVSAHSSGNAVDIAKINGIPILGNQGAGSITDIAVRRLLTLQGTMKPAQVITLMKYEGTDNTLAMADHNDHIHAGFRPEFDPTTKAGKIAESVLKPSQWIKLIDRLGQIDNQTVALRPSKYAIKVGQATRASRAHNAE
ncbi:MAG: hypothetical protein ACRDMZ_01855, partial [Solirubrobacteraceae bacterium]